MKNDEVDFWCLVDDAAEKWKDIEDTYQLEPYLLKILEYVKKANDKDRFEKYFIEMLDQSGRPAEIFQYCMHDLKWRNVRNVVEKKLTNASDPREISILQMIFESFDDDWVDKDLYQRYSKKENI